MFVCNWVEDPWSFVLYTDEVAPRDAFAPDPKRKYQCLKITSVDLGMAARDREDAWACVRIHRSIYVKTIKGGMGQLTGAFANNRLFPNEGTHFQETGLLLTHAGSVGTIPLHVRLKVLVQGGAAHREIRQTKGDVGLRKCSTCDAIHPNSDLPKYAAAVALRQHVIRGHEILVG